MPTLSPPPGRADTSLGRSVQSAGDRSAALATSVFGGVKAKLGGLQQDVRERDATIVALAAEVEAAKKLATQQ